jgi:hypothetical protein
VRSGVGVGRLNIGGRNKSFVASTDTSTARARLLHDVRQLVGEQTATGVRPRREPARTEDDVVTQRVSFGAHVLRGLLGSRAGMHPHTGKVVAEAPLHVLP